MPWTLSDERACRRLERAFSNRGIPYANPAFYDTAEFLREEERNPRILETYAHYVEARNYSEDYLADARQKVVAVIEAVRREVKADGKPGRCVHASGIIGRMLDSLGAWNYVAKSTLTIEFSEGRGVEPIYFWAIDQGKFYAPHAFVVAPPFSLIDVPGREQPSSDDVPRDELPDVVLAETFERVSWTPEDLANEELRIELMARRIAFNTFLARNRPHLLEVANAVKPRATTLGETRLKYVIVAIGGITEPLEQMHQNIALNGRLPMQIFENDVLPRLPRSAA